ncbi:MAG TPA: glycosyltransferase family 87 protein [Steroidobacteraceae bacterium]
MSGSFGRLCKGLLLVGLLVHLLVSDVMPAFAAISSDFPVYYTSANIVRAGQDAAKLYDAPWFRGQMQHYGVGTQYNNIAFAPYPPPTALLLVPLAGLQPLSALRVLIVLNVLLLGCSTLLLSRIFQWRLVDSALFVLLSGHALHTEMAYAHPYIIISTLCLLGYYLYLQRMPWLAGLCLGLFVPIKYRPLSILAGFGLLRQWRVLLGGGIGTAAVVLLSIVVLGWEVHSIFLSDVVLTHLSGRQSPAALAAHSAQAQSFDMMFAQLFILDPLQNPHPWLALEPGERELALVATKVLLVLAAVPAMVKLIRGTAATSLAPTIGILAILPLLIAPGSGTYAYVLLWLPVSLLIDYFCSTGARLHGYFIFAIYALIGFIPYGHANQFIGRGGLTVLAYPRLFLLLAMFIVCIQGVMRSPRQDDARLQSPTPATPPR